MKSISSRISKAFKIFDLGLNEEALRIIASSTRVDDASRKKAEEILKEIK